jgi:type III secretion system (T3SS) SseB-like protein
MLPIDPASPDAVPVQAMAHGGTYLRPGAVAWGGRPGGPDGAYSSCEMVEQVLAAVIKDADRMNDLLDELSRARLWVPLPVGQRPVTDGSAVALPTVTYLGAEFVPAFTSVQRLGAGRGAPHIVVPAAALARRLPAGLGIALNPGAKASVPIYPEGVAYLAATQGSAGGVPIRVGHPPAEPEALLREVRSGLHRLPAVRQASRAWLSVPGRGEGLIISVTLDDPASEPAHEAVVEAIEHAVAAIPHQVPFPIDVTFPGEAEPDLLDDWVASNAPPFYTRG